MKKNISIIMAVVLILTMCSMNVFAETHVHNDKCAELTATGGGEASVYAVYPSCPRDASHTGRVAVPSSDGSVHTVYCKVCSSTIKENEAHYWATGTPNCTTRQYCLMCSYNAPGGEALGHLVHPTSQGEFISINSTTHGHVCLRDYCEYNPSSSLYYYTVGYLEDEPHGPHLYYSPTYYSTYKPAATGVWMHKGYRDCEYCDYVKQMGTYECVYQNSNCQGGCLG